jgi:hypothetical protein
MSEAILKMHYPLGVLPGRGFVCPVCKEERFLAADLEQMQELAHTLGLFGLQGVQQRTLLRTGNSLAVSIDPDLLRDVLGNPNAGDKVRVGRQGNRIVIESAD